MTYSALLNVLRKAAHHSLKIVSWIYKQLKNVVLNPKAYSILLEQVQVSTQHTVHSAAVSRISSPKQWA